MHAPVESPWGASLRRWTSPERLHSSVQTPPSASPAAHRRERRDRHGLAGRGLDVLFVYHAAGGTMTLAPRKQLRKLLAGERIIMAPGAYDALLARIIEQ